MAATTGRSTTRPGRTSRLGAFKTLPPGSQRCDVAVKAAAIGRGLYGVDLKETEGGVVVIEINDNPNLDAGVEDDYLGDELYRQILQEFIDRVQAKRAGQSL